MAPAAAGLAFTLVPRHVLGGPGYTAPSDKITIAYVGCGTQGTREMLRLIAAPEVRITAVWDPVKDGTNYIDWSKTGIRDAVRRTLEDPNWGSSVSGIRAGREMAKEIIETYYAKTRGSENFKSVASYADFRELLENEKDLDDVKIMTPDHLHATISSAAMKKRKNVLVHKPLSNRVEGVRMLVEAARKTGVSTHLLAWRAPLTAVRQMILEGAIGNLKEEHNWTDRPFWPQQLALPGIGILFHRTSIGIGGWDRSMIASIIPVTLTPFFAAGTISAGAASRTWAITAYGRSSWPWNCR